MEQSHKIKKRDKMSYFLNDPPYHPRKKCWAGYPPYGRSSPAHADTRRRGAAEENVPSVLQSKTCIPPPRGGEKAKLLHQWRLQTWTSVCPRRGCPCKSTLGPLQPSPALPNLSFSLFFFLFFLNCCCFGSMDSTYISHFLVSEFEFCFLSASISPQLAPHMLTHCFMNQMFVCFFFLLSLCTFKMCQTTYSFHLKI